MVDRRGVLLREFLNDEQGRGQWKPLQEISQSFLQATIAIEDKRFRHHPGVDPLALVRALIEDIKAGEWQSGGSTLTQQVIRNVYHYPRTLWHKLLEMWYALRLERMLSKDEILEQYVNRAPYGNQLFGIEAAARRYFGKPARDLSLAESAFLAGLPNAPSLLNPYANIDAPRARQRRVLKHMLEQELISDQEYRSAWELPLNPLVRRARFHAPHFVEMVAQELKAYPGVARAQTTLDFALQEDVEWIVKGHLATLVQKQVTNAAVVVIDNRTREIRALVGSSDYFDDRNGGQVNGALSLRQPGSSIKPFTYGAALEAGYTPATILADIPTHLADREGDYMPENYDRTYHGPVRLRTALACSYNVPAVRVAQRIGVEALLQRLHAAGFGSLAQPAAYYGYGLTLGNGEVTLLELTNAYASIANGGLWQPVRMIHALQPVNRSVEGEWEDTGRTSAQRRIFNDQVSFLLTNILSDPVARRPAFGSSFRFSFPCAVKTGTTKDYRDNWTVGFTTEHTVGVWTGNFDGKPMRGVSGVTGAGQIFRDVIMLLHKHSPPGEFSVPSGLTKITVCTRSGKLPTEACGKTIVEWFLKAKEPTERCDVHRRYRVVEEGRRSTRVYEILPPEFRTWAEQERISSPPAGSVEIRMPQNLRLDESQARDQRPSILYPNDGDQFKLDPVLRPEYQSVRILGAVPERSSKVTLRVDEGTAGFDPLNTWWTLQRGKHKLRLEAIVGGARQLSDPVTIYVE